VDDPVVKAILDATEDPNVIAEKLSAALSRKNHYHMSVIGGYKGELDMERPPNDEEVAAASIAGTINRLGGKDDPDVKAILDATEDPNVIAEQLHQLCSRINHISNVLGAGGGVLVKNALGEMSLANATDEDVNAVIESFDSQLYQTHRLNSCRQRIGNALGADGVEQVKKALALDNKSLADVSDGDLDVIIKSLQSVAQGKKAYKTRKDKII
jgi:hypothetical protein